MEQFHAILENKPEHIREIALQIRQLILDTDKRLEEYIYGGAKVRMALYCIGNANNAYFGIQPDEDHCKLFFHHSEKIDTTGIYFDGNGIHAKHANYSKLDEATVNRLKQAFSDTLKAVASNL